MAMDFGLTNSVLISMTVSVFVLAYAVGPLFLGPLSEIFGRSRVLQISNLFFLVWNFACGFAQNQGQLIAFRFLSGLGGSAPSSVGGGVLADVFRAEERGMAMALYSLAPLLGPVLGPVTGGWISERSTWRWVFYSTTILDVVVQVLGFFFLQETFAPVLLERKARRIRKSMDPEKGENAQIRTVFEGENRTWRAIFRKALIRPFLLFYHEVIVQLLAIYMAIVYGIYYLFLTTMTDIFEGTYHEKVGIAGLNYIPLGFGVTVAAQINARIIDRVYVHLKNKNGGVGEPEFRLPTMVPGTLIIPIGILLTGWTSQEHVHWIVTDIGIFLIGAGIIFVFQGMQTYIVDAFTLYAASALAAASCFRSLAGFGFPLFAPKMYETLGFGKGDTILAAGCIAFGCPAPFLFWKYGKRIRMSSKYAKKS